MRPIPKNADDLTPAWLTAALSETGVLKRGRVDSVECERVGQEFGFASFVARVQLRYDGADHDAPRTVIVKLPASEDVDAYESCAREERFYREIGGELAPRLYYSAVGDTAHRVVLVLEDLSAGRQGDVLRGCSIDDAALVIDCIAPFHARWWHEPAPAERFRVSGGDEQDYQERYDQRAGVFLQRYGKRVPAEIRDLVQRLRSRLAAVRQALAAGPKTLIHGDLHLDNMIFDGRADRPVAVLDWQTVRIGAPAWDVALFLFDSLDVDERRAVDAALLERYATLLAANGLRDYGVDALLRDCRLALLARLAGTVGWLAREDATGRAGALQQAALDNGRLVAALLDHDAAALL